MCAQFQVGGTLKKDNFYIKRDADELLFQAILANQFCYVLSSRQIGKSSLMVRTALRLKDEGYAVALTDITGIGTTHSEAKVFYNTLFKNICRGVKVEYDPQVFDYDNYSIDYNFELFIDYILTHTSQQICIFIDEIDKIIDLDENQFDTDDFFSFLRYIKNKAAEKKKYERINFVVLGVATPSDLIKNKERTPFNIGTKIELKNFTFDEAKLLSTGLQPKFENAEQVLKEIIKWTGGQPYLTQRFCQLAIDYRDDTSNLEEYITKLASTHFINEAETEHNLSNIRDRILKNKEYNFEMLLLLKRITQGEAIEYDSKDKPQEYLRLSGLINNKGQKLAFTNRIYKEVFTKEWVEEKFNFARFPFKLDLLRWETNDRSKYFLLKGQLLKEAVEWQRNRDEVSKTEREFIESSRAEADKIAENEKKSRYIYYAVLGLATLMAFFLFLITWQQKNLIQRQKDIIESENIAAQNVNEQLKLKYQELRNTEILLQEKLKSVNDSIVDAIDRLDVLKQSANQEIDSLSRVHAKVTDKATKLNQIVDRYRVERKVDKEEIDQLHGWNTSLISTVESLKSSNDALVERLNRTAENDSTTLEVGPGKSHAILNHKFEFSTIILNQGASLIVGEKFDKVEIVAANLIIYDNAKIVGKGKDGQNGKLGQRGANGMDCQSGDNGNPGEKGTNGQNGKTIVLRVNKIIKKGNSNLVVDVTGGKGGDGGNGGDGGAGGNSDCTSNCSGGDGGNGGNGGLAGKGGIQGSVIKKQDLGNVTVLVEPGEDGQLGVGGYGGQPGSGKKCVFSTKESGARGEDGSPNPGKQIRKNKK